MKLRARLLVLSISTVALIVTMLFALHLDSLTRNWLDSALERSNGAGHEIQRDIVARIGESAPSTPGEPIEETKKAWTQVVATDQSLTDAMVEQAARPAASIVEINVIGEQGHVTGIDMTPDMAAKARRSVAEMGLANVTIVDGSAEELPFADAGFDVVISNGVIDLIPDKEAVFSEIARVLRPGGRIQLADVTIQQPVSEEGRRNIDLWTG